MVGMKAVLCAFVAVLLAGCGSVTTKVTRFNVWPADVAGAEFSYLRPLVSAGEVEQATYESYVGRELEQLGLKPGQPDKPPRFLAEVIADHTQREKRVLEPVYQNALIYSGPTRDRYGNVYGGYWAPYVPSFGALGAGPSVGGGYGSAFGPVYVGEQEVTRTVQVNRLRVKLYDAQAGTAGRPRAVFESTAVYEGSNEDLAELVPYLVQAIFTGFPGKSGEVRMVKFEEKKRETVRR